MAENSISPGYIRIYYQDASFIHKMQLGVNSDFVETLGEYLVEEKGGATDNWKDKVDEWIALMRPLTHTSMSWLYAELWQADFESGEETFKALHEIGVAGTSVTVTEATRGTTWSYFTTGGGNGKVVLLGSVAALNSAYRPPAYGATTIKAVADYLASGESFVYARDNTYPALVGRVLTKTFDALRKKVVLNS